VAYNWRMHIFEFCYSMQLKKFLEKTKHEGRGKGYITTFSGRRRPIKALGSSEQGCKAAASQRVAAEADRKAVNSTIQGSAADLIKLAMCSWAAWQHAHNCTGVRLHICCSCTMQFALFRVPALKGHLHAHAELCTCMPWLL
jgi:DNA polymerase I-like protein with 3'-5' exonuclease and polymerase domains